MEKDKVLEFKSGQMDKNNKGIERREKEHILRRLELQGFWFKGNKTY